MIIQKILIANRGEIAERIMRTCKDMGIQTVAVYAEPDAEAPFVRLADEAIALGGKQPGESYLVMDKIIDAAKRSGATAIHPGFGFLSENAAFAQRCADEGLTFIGPRPECIDSMGDKKTAKELVSAAGVPVIPGYDGADQSTEVLSAEAVKIGFPVLLKASAGGGGKGMRIVWKKEDLAKEIDGAKREALGAFGNDTLLIEKYFESVRHIEFQIMGDRHGNAVHLFERECSIQRRYQKIIEETPSVALTDELRAKMGESSIQVANSIGYDNAGTVEYILTPEGEYYFLEVNTRLQVEHPVTEMVTGLDIVKLQIEVAEGKELPISQADLTQTGHAVECRLYAEDPYNDFLPVTGVVQQYTPYEMEGLRFDSGVESGSLIDVYYDPMIAKVIAYGANRDTAIRKLVTALENTVLLGTRNNKKFLVDILKSEGFGTGAFDTQFLKNNPDLTSEAAVDDELLADLAIATTLSGWSEREGDRKLLQNVPSGWRSNFYEAQKLAIEINGESTVISYRVQAGIFTFQIGENNYEVTLVDSTSDQLTFTVDGYQKKLVLARYNDQIYIHHPQQGSFAVTIPPRFPEAEAEVTPGGYNAPMPGQIVKLLVKAGDKVASGDGLLIINSMKMENTIEAFEAGVVEEIFVEENALIEADTLLLKIAKE